MENKERGIAGGHLAALVTVGIWGTTFIWTKILLTAFTPVEILLFRFLIGWLALLVACPRFLRGTNRSQELLFAAAGLCGVCLYYLLENVALTYTLASNVGIIVAVAPFFTAVFARIFLRSNKLNAGFMIGFAVAMTGIILISLGGSALELDPVGDLLALAAAIVWACYSILVRKISVFGYPTILVTRRIFAYGILFMIPVTFFFPFNWDLRPLQEPQYLLNLLMLGLGASALCFVTWNYAVKTLGVVTTSIYIYLTPVITVVFSAIFLDEQLTGTAVTGAVMTLAGLFLSSALRARRKAHPEHGKGNSDSGMPSQ